MKKFFQLIQSGREADIVIYGDITSWEWLESDVSSYTLTRTLQDLDADTINVHINSCGGEVAEGWAIYNALRSHKAKVRTVCDGFACSAASLVFMAGEERVMNTVSLLMIHNAWCGAVGSAKELRKAADEIEVISDTSANAYRTHVNLSDEKLAELLDNETWISPQDAVAWGFATEVLEDAPPKGPSQSARGAVMRAILEHQDLIRMLFGRKPQVPQAQPPKDPEPRQKNLSTFFDALAKGGKE